MDKKILIIGGIISAVAGFFILRQFSSGASSDGSGATGGGIPPPFMGGAGATESTVFDMPINITFPENPFPEFDFSLPDPGDYRTNGGGTYTKKQTKTIEQKLAETPTFEEAIAGYGASESLAGITYKKGDRIFKMRGR